jgi:hypothetical protein
LVRYLKFWVKFFGSDRSNSYQHTGEWRAARSSSIENERLHCHEFASRIRREKGAYRYSCSPYSISLNDVRDEVDRAATENGTQDRGGHGL